MAFDDLSAAEDSCLKNHPYRNTFSSTTTDEYGPYASGELEKIDSSHDEDESHIRAKDERQGNDDDQREHINRAQNLSAQTTSSTNTTHHEAQEPEVPSGLPERVASRMSASSTLTFPEGGLAGWLAVVGSFSAMLSIFGLINSSAVFESYFSEHQLKDYNSSQIGWIFSLYLFMVFFVGIQVGPIFDRHGPRWLVSIGSLFMVLSLMLLGFCTGENVLCDLRNLRRLADKT